MPAPTEMSSRPRWPQVRTRPSLSRKTLPASRSACALQNVSITPALRRLEVRDLHIGLKGMMNALFLKDLADKTRRGQRGRIEAGKSGGGNSYGYDVVKEFAPIARRCAATEQSTRRWGGLQRHLMDPALIDIFCTDYTRHLNRLRSEAVASSDGRKAELAKIDRETGRLVDAIPAARVKDRLTELDACKTELEALIADAPAPPPVLVHPRMAGRYLKL